MPIVLHQEDQNAWPSGADIENFPFPYEVELEAKGIGQDFAGENWWWGDDWEPPKEAGPASFTESEAVALAGAASGQQPESQSLAQGREIKDK